jgi:UDP-N-acetylmuramate dehydrogenase
MQIIQNKSLKKYNTFGVEAKAKYYARVTEEKQIPALIGSKEFQSEKHFILGGGSNVLFKGDFDGLVINIDIKGLKFLSMNREHSLLEVKAGEVWHDFVKTCTENSMFGVENLALIPGKVGAAPVQNIGAYGVEQVEYFESLEGFHLEEGKFYRLGKDDCNFAYRDSIFKNKLKGKFIITSVNYRLNKQWEPIRRYKEIDRELDKFSFINPDVKFVFDMICRIRNSKLPDPVELGNSGSFLKNPIVSNEKYDELKSQFPDIPGYETGSGIKLSAGWLIQQCGWKGRRLREESDAAVYEKHALIIVNHGNATGAEIFELSEKIIESVRNKFDVVLEREVNVV